MKTFLKLAILTALALLFTYVVKAQPTPITVLAKNEVFVAPQNNTIVMDKYNFAKYDYAVKQSELLKKEVLIYDSLLCEKDSTIEFIQVEFNELWLHNQDQIRDMSTAYQNLQAQSQQVMNLNKQLQIDYKKLEIKKSRANKWRNIFMGTAVFSTTLLVLLVTH